MTDKKIEKEKSVRRRVLIGSAPVIAALVIVAVLLFSPINISPTYSQKDFLNFANDPGSRASFIGYSVKSQALADKNFLPIMGSSELERVNSYSPGVFSYKYNTSYTPYLIGMPGTQSLTQYFYLHSVASEMKNRKVVFIISPQWFTQRGLIPSAFQDFISKGEIYNWLESANPKDSATQELAKRLLQFQTLQSDTFITASLKKIANGQSIGGVNTFAISLSNNLWQHEDQLFSSIDLQKEQKQNPVQEIENYALQLPDRLNYDVLSQNALQEAKNSSTNNPFRINNAVWTNSLASRWKNMEGYQEKTSYLKSPEYADFQQLLNEFAANHNDVQFIIQPINGEWYNYTGLSIPMMEQFTEKIKYQLTSQGFTNIVDYTDKYDTPYFINDTDHFGTVGWVAVDQAINRFMAQPSQTPNYRLNNDYFLSQSWASEK